MAECRRGVEQQFAEVLHGRQLGQASAAHLVRRELRDAGEARVDVLDPAVAIDKDEGAGALFDGAAKQLQAVGRADPLLVGQHLGVLIGQLAGEGDLVGLPVARCAVVLKTQDAGDLAADPDGCVKDRTNAARGEKGSIQFFEAGVVGDIAGFQRAAVMQCVEITGAGRQIDMGGVFETVILAQEGRNGFGPAAVEMPDRRSPHVEGFDGGLGDQ